MENQPDLTPAIEAVYRDHRSVFLRVLNRRTADPDISEEILQDAIHKIATMENQHYNENPAGYLMRTAINLSTDWLCQTKSRNARERDWVAMTTANTPGSQPAVDAPAADEIVSGKEDVARLYSALEELSAPVRTAFILHKINGLSHAETATQMNLSTSTVEKHMMKAMRHVVDVMSI